MFRNLMLGVLIPFTMVGVVHADRPRAVAIQTEMVFAEVGEGTFTATPPLCPSGTKRALREVKNPSLTHGHGFTVDWLFTCDDDSGTFQIQYHPQAGANYARTAEPEFTLAGPWAIGQGGTGRYSKLRGHGDFGVVIDFSTEPWTGQESFVGLVQLD